MARGDAKDLFFRELRSAGLSKQAVQALAKRLDSLESNSGAYVVTLGVSNGTDDTATINAALAAGAGTTKLTVKGLPGQTYKTSAPLVSYSQTTLDMTGCTVQLNAGSNCNMWNNRAVSTAAGTSTGTIAAGSTTLTTTLSATAVVGQSVAIAGAGGVNLAGTAGPHVATVTAAGGGTITLSRAAVTTVSGAAVSIYTRDTDIKVIGGMWDRQTNGGTNNNLHSIFGRHLDRVEIAQGRYTSPSGGKYAISLGDVTDFDVHGWTLNTSSDGVHITGPATRGTVDNIKGTTGDDFTALGLSDYGAYADTQGDIFDVVLTRLFPNNTSTGQACKMFGGAGYLMRNVTVRGVRGVLGGNAVGVLGQSGDSAILDADGILIEDIKPTSYVGALVNVTASLGRTIRFRDLQTYTTASGQTLVVLSPGAVVDVVDISGVRVPGTPTSFTTLSINQATVGDIVLDDVQTVQSGGYVLALGFNATSLVTGTTTLSRIKTTGASGVVQAAHASNTLPTLFLSAVETKNCVWLLDIATPTAVYLNGVQHKTPTSGVANIRATAALFVRGAGIVLDPGSLIWNMTAGGKVTMLAEGLPASTSAGAFPTNTPAVGAGTSPTVTVAGTDIRGSASVAVGTSPASGALVTVNFTQSLGTAPKSVTLTPTNATAAAANAYVSGKTPAGWTISLPGTPSGTYTWDYSVGV